MNGTSCTLKETSCEQFAIALCFMHVSPHSSWWLDAGESGSIFPYLVGLPAFPVNLSGENVCGCDLDNVLSDMSCRETFPQKLSLSAKLPNRTSETRTKRILDIVNQLPSSISGDDELSPKTSRLGRLSLTYIKLP